MANFCYYFNKLMPQTKKSISAHPKSNFDSVIVAALQLLLADPLLMFLLWHGLETASATPTISLVNDATLSETNYRLDRLSYLLCEKLELMVVVIMSQKWRIVKWDKMDLHYVFWCKVRTSTPFESFQFHFVSTKIELHCITWFFLHVMDPPLLLNSLIPFL
jgi:hypothetical protein